MAEKRRPRVFLWVLVGLLVLGAVTACVLYALVQREDSRWPSLAETPRVSGAVAPVVDDGRAWEQLATAIDSFPAELPDYDAILEREGTPSADVVMTWQPLEDRIAILRDVVMGPPGLAIPRPTDPMAPSVSLIPFLKLCRAWLLSGWAHASSGAPARAVTEMLHVQALAVRFMRGDTGLVETMIGIAIHEQARLELRELLDTFGAEDPALLAHAAAGLVPLDPGAIARALVVEANVVEPIFTTSMDEMPWVNALSYDEALTRVWYRMHMQRVVDRAVTNYWERTPLEPLPLWSVEGGLVQQLHNRTGRILLDMTLTDFARMLTREDAAVASSRLDVLRLAVRRYAIEHGGTLPSSQAELVPAYLSAPLVDPYDGEPLRLDGESVWSVGGPDAPDDVVLRHPLAVPTQRE